MNMAGRIVDIHRGLLHHSEPLISEQGSNIIMEMLSLEEWKVLRLNMKDFGLIEQVSHPNENLVCGPFDIDF
jgi:hypothetical protein